VAPAQAERQAAKLREEELLQQAKEKRKVRQLNQALKKDEALREAEAYNSTVSRALGLAKEDRQLWDKIFSLQAKQRGEQQESGLAGPGRAAQFFQRRALKNRQRANVIDQYTKILSQDDVDEELKEKIKAELRKKGYGKDEIANITDQSTIDMLKEDVENLEARADRFTRKQGTQMGKIDSPERAAYLDQQFVRNRAQGGRTELTPVDQLKSQSNLDSGGDDTSDSETSDGTETQSDTNYLDEVYQ